MAEKDLSAKKLEDYSEVFADIYNTLLFRKRGSASGTAKEWTDGIHLQNGFHRIPQPGKGYPKEILQ